MPLKNSSSLKSKTQNSLTLSSLYHPPIKLQNIYIYFHICSHSNCCLLCVVNKWTFLYIYKEFQELSVVLHILFNSALCDLVLLFSKNSLWPSISLLTNQNVLVFKCRCCSYKFCKIPRKHLLKCQTVFSTKL